MADAVITTITRKKTIEARAGTRQLPTIVGMAFGNGGIGSDGNQVSPTISDNSLKNELLRKEIDGYEFTSETSCKYTCTLDEDELADQKISELALYDSDGDLVCIKTFSEKGKDSDFEMAFSVKDFF